MIGRVWKAMLAAADFRTWAILGAGCVATALSIGRTLIIWLGPWPKDRAEQQLEILGWVLLTDQLVNILIVIALTGLGVAASVGKTGVTLNVGDEDRAKLETPGGTKIEVESKK